MTRASQNLDRPPLDIAVVGSGIAGLSAAWLLSRGHRVTLYEGASRFGGHSNTVAVPEVAGRMAIDTGFIVFNEKTYPNLTALFRHLKVETQPSEMSFSVSRDGGKFEYSGGDLKGLLAQPQNLLRPRFWSMLRDLLRFYAQAPREMEQLEAEGTSVGSYLTERGYGAAFREDHLLPMASAIWSTPTAQIGEYPAGAFLRFCTNHGLLQITGRPVWRTVTGGSSTYVYRMLGEVSGRIHNDRRICRVTRCPDGVRLLDESGEEARHDHVVIATHAHQARAMLADTDGQESALLGAFGTTSNTAVLHTDESLMPRRRRAWAAWNFCDQPGRGEGAPFLTYWMNRLQNLPSARNYFVTINPPRPPAPGTLLHTDHYSHPLFKAASIAAQKRLWEIQGQRRTWFCGAWFGAGFHEDGLQAGLAVAEALGGVRRPWQVANPSGRIHLPQAHARPLRAAAA
ncbi:MAG TPA: FAD-dependent oxidoreductase [Acidisoma sp.]|uniref:NAD(P)/FAD-dependent oxidoreductase n=1 Tax=Acidisoma sp. TaxID=1872115 RepID=UPI002B8494DC|nr:FAD-dependent oxidoreductase [Acidisoma sp.]HTI03564.1 FAD-dependent oxidoreductase [Acidisoma sp.]